ncbi:hypothetical protein DRW07_10930 [Alteromonas sediminis]|uniref:Uncharacterized protein n=1 Tax=Alteromonas sediminis TaxID=2259342 RepID=A0A3N5Y0H8_9ALTE|nr:hypothetical protein [Alteromonas sediminis]RPJ66590.1 hypothetical protein DRW07_10930 [Alteromonas sediminis]
MSAGFYSIEKVDNLILLRTSGEWSLALDIAYLGDVSQTFKAARGKPFNVFVDMRGLKISQDVKDTPLKKDLVLDRRSQRAEYWLADNLSESEYLLPYFEHVSFPLHRLTDKAQAWDIIRHKLCDERHWEKVSAWLDAND